MQAENIRIAQKNLVPVSRQAAGEGIVLLENKDATLPLAAGSTIAVFGRCQINTYRSGTGSGGAVNVPYAINILQGLRENGLVKVDETLAGIYENWINENPFDDGGGGWAAEPWFQKEMPLQASIVEQSAQCSDHALIIIGRTAGEDQDNADAPGSYRLTDAEVQMIEQVNAAFANVIVVLNVTNIIDMSWLNSVAGKESIKAVLYSWAAGMEGGHALADILSGKITPSGRLTDTIAYRLEDYPSADNFGRKDANCYAEDIYVGYRYFETFNPDAVQYEFGAGLSYTQFDQELVSYTETGSDSNQLLSFKIKLTNSGTQFSGKEVVQLYVQAPQGLLGKPARILAGFAKSQTLKPGDSEVVSIDVAVRSLASFDDSGVTGHANAFVLEAGDYQFYMGASVRKAQKIAAAWHLGDLLIVEQLSEALAPIKPFDRLKPGAENADGTFQKIYEPVSLRSIDLAERIQTNLPESFAITGDQGIKLIDVKNGLATLQDFVAQMNEQQLASIVRGEGMCSPKVTPGTAAAFGGVTESLFALGIPIAAAADGPSGIRMDSGHKATQVPIGTLLACTWNIQLNQRLFNLVGEEMRANKIDTLLGPGINIHRHPLNGRNFEYFSEDPLMTGLMAAAQTNGLKAAGVSGTIKHYAANDQETARSLADSVMSQRALREIHLKPFEIAVKQGQASTIMTAYNPVNGHWAASNYDLNTTILRGEWGYSGIVMTDWWAKMNDPVNAGEPSTQFTSFMVRSQNDLYMVVENDGAESNSMQDNTLEALKNGSLTIGELQRCAMNICRFILDAPVMSRPLDKHDSIPSFYAIESLSRAEALCIKSPVAVNSDHNLHLVIDVPEEAIYQINGNVRFDKDALAQSTCSIYINSTFAMTLSLHGSDDKVHQVVGLPVKLEKGLHEIYIDFIKPGMEVESLEIVKR